jgi:biotin carboxyl carrier protein
MPDDRTRPSAAARTAEERAADHAVIDQLADDLLPALVAKLGASGLGEIEVREGPWRLRVRRPIGTDRGRRAMDSVSRSQPGHAGHGHPPAGFEGHRSAREARPGAVTSHSGNGSAPQLTAVGPGPERDPDTAPHPDPRPGQAIATSPAVGVYQPRASATPGTRVRAGDRVGAVDMLGVAQEVVAPSDGLIGASLVEPGQAVEYGQELVIIELAVAPAREG